MIDHGTRNEATRAVKSRRPRMLMSKRALIQFCIYIAFGTAMTIVVAWTLTVFVDVPGEYLSWRYIGRSSDQQRAWLTIIEKRIGRYRVERFYDELEDGAANGAELPVLNAPRWSRELAAPSGFEALDMGNSYVDDASGWPLLCLVTHVEDSLEATSGDPPFSMQSSVSWGIPFEWVSTGTVYRALPLKPLVLGFVANVLVFALGAWGIVRGCRAARHYGRRLQGMCPSCEYDLRGDFSVGCPECGWRRKEVSS